MALARLQESFFYFILVEGCTRPEFKEKEKKSREAFCPKSLLPTTSAWRALSRALIAYLQSTFVLIHIFFSLPGVISWNFNRHMELCFSVLSL